MSTGEQAHPGPPNGLELRVASPEGIRDTCTPWHCAGAARHIVPTQYPLAPPARAGVRSGQVCPSGGQVCGAPHTVPAQYPLAPPARAGVRSGQVCPSGRCRAGQQPCGHPSRVLYGELPGGSWQSLPPPCASRAGETSGADGPARQVRASALFGGTASHP